MLNQLLADVYIFTDHMAGPEAGLSPGYGIMLVAETTAGRFLSAEAAVAADAMVREWHLKQLLTCFGPAQLTGCDMDSERRN